MAHALPTHTCIGLNHTSSLLKVIEQNYQQLSDILETNFDPSGLSSMQKLKTVYDSCVDMDSIDRLGVQPLLDLITSTGKRVGLRSTLYRY